MRERNTYRNAGNNIKRLNKPLTTTVQDMVQMQLL